MRNTPYLHVYMRPGEGAERLWQAVFAVRLLSCPTEREDETRIASQRLEEHVDFINSLFWPELGCTFAIRYLTHPHPTAFSAGKVEVTLLGKASAATQEQAGEQAGIVCNEVIAQLGGSFPDYAWEIVAEAAMFQALWEPFPWETAYVAEVRRREDLVRLETVRPRPALGRGAGTTTQARGADEAVYFVYPFIPRPRGLGRLLRTLLLHQAPVLFQATLAPVRLHEAEEQALMEAISMCERYGQRREALSRESAFASQTIHELRAQALCRGLLDQLLRLQDAPFALTITLASPLPLPRPLVEAAGVAVSAPVGHEVTPSTGQLFSPHLGGYDVVFPQTEEERAQARDNGSFLETAPWGESLAPATLRRVRFLVDAREAASAFRFPLTTVNETSGLEVHTARTRPLPREVARLGESANAEERLLLGENHYLGLRQPVFLREKDRRQHVYVIGQTGTGKTTLLKTMILEDMAAGRGLAVIDPHGDLFKELLQYIPPQRQEDIIILDPTDVEFPVGLNLLECVDEDQRHFVVREMRAIMERLIEDQYRHMAAEFAGPVFYQHMQMNMLLAMSNPDDPGTLLEFREIFQHENYWRRWLPLRWQEAQLVRWVESNLPNIDYTERYRTDMTWGEYLSSKFDDFVFDPKLRLIFGQKRSTIDLGRVMDEGQILLVNLAKGKLAEANARFLGMVLMAKIQATAMKRVYMPPEQRRIFYIYVDEFQSLATQNFVILLSEARKFGLGLVLANQFVSQIHNERIIQSIFGNVGTLISFRVGQADAELLQPQFVPFFDRLDLTNLPNWRACVRTTVDGQIVTPFSLHTILPNRQPNPQLAEAARDASRARYGRPRQQVEEEIKHSLTY